MRGAGDDGPNLSWLEAPVGNEGRKMQLARDVAQHIEEADNEHGPAAIVQHLACIAERRAMRLHYRRQADDGPRTDAEKEQKKRGRVLRGCAAMLA